MEHRKENESHHDQSVEEPQEKSVPWIRSPMNSWDERSDSFSPRHEASTIELFFDLFFVANLATFTQYHAITNRQTFWSYVAFFITLWMSWFHIVCFDARFTSDSVWERTCKVVHFGTFAAFALIGYKFVLLVPATPRWIYRVLCWTLFTSRFWLGLQYLITAIFCSVRKHKQSRLAFPLYLNTGVFFVAAIMYGSLFAGFADTRQNLKGVVIGVYSVIVLELVGTLGISCFWRKLSFRATHIGERLGLLGLIIIGEGVIGTTKTIVRIMGKKGPYLEGSGLVLCLILILVFIWILYFDNLPTHRFSSIRQQFWMALHLPLHLAILGVVEGSQHIVLARYIFYSSWQLRDFIWNGCMKSHLSGPALRQNLTDAIAFFKISDSAQGNLSLPLVYDEIYKLGNQTDVCSPANTKNIPFDNGLQGLPIAFSEFGDRAMSSMFQAFDIDIPPEGRVQGILVATRSWEVVYTYYWSAILLLLVCLTASALLADRGLHFVRFRLTALVARGLMMVAAVVLLVLAFKKQGFANDYLGSSWVLPTVVWMLWLVCLADRLSRWGREDRKEEREARKRYQSVGEIEQASEEDEHRRIGEGAGLARSMTARHYGYPGR